MKISRRQFLHLAAGAAALPALSRITLAQAYPTKPVRIASLMRDYGIPSAFNLPAGRTRRSSRLSGGADYAASFTEISASQAVLVGIIRSAAWILCRRRHKVHKTANVLANLPNSQQLKAKRALQEIWMAETKADAEILPHDLLPGLANLAIGCRPRSVIGFGSHLHACFSPRHHSPML